MSEKANSNSISAKFLAAIKKSKKDIVLEILEQHDVDLNERGSNGNTYLHLAVSNAKEGKSTCEKIIEILTILLDRGMNIDVKNKLDQTVLQKAILLRSIEIVNYLLEHNANINVIDKRGYYIVHALIEDERKAFGQKPSKVSAKKREWLEKRSIYFIDFLLTKGFDFDRRNDQGMSALHMALKYNLQHILPTLLTSTNDINFVDQRGRTFLQMFIDINYVDFNLYPSTKSYGGRYLSSIIKTLFHKGVSLEVADNQEGKTVLQVAFELYDVNLVKLLVDNAVENDDKHLTKFLHYLIKNLDKNDILDTNEVNFFEDLIKTLVSKTIRFQNEPISENTTVQLAVLEKRLDILKLLSENKVGFDVLTFDRKNLLHLLSQDVEPDKIRHRSDVEYEEIFDILVNQGCDVNAIDQMKQTPLHAAAANGKIAVMNKLMKHGVDVNFRKDYLMWTPLHVAADSDQPPKVAELLIENGANVNLRDTCGRTPLHMTLEKNGRLTRTLLCSGARADVRDKRKLTPLYSAISRKYLQEVEELLKYGANFDDFFPIQSLAPLLDENPTRAIRLLDFILPTHWIKLSVAELPCSTQYKTLVERKNFQWCYNACREEIERLKNFFVDDRMTVLNFLQMDSNRRCIYINSEKLKKLIESPLDTKFPNYSDLILAAYHEASTRKPLLGPAMHGWIELTKVVLPDICVDRILSYLSVADLLNLTDEE